MLSKANTEKVKRILDKRGTYYLKSGDYIVDWGDGYSIRHANGDCIKFHWRVSEILDLCEDWEV